MLCKCVFRMEKASRPYNIDSRQFSFFVPSHPAEKQIGQVKGTHSASICIIPPYCHVFMLARTLSKVYNPWRSCDKKVTLSCSSGMALNGRPLSKNLLGQYKLYRAYGN